MSFCKCLSAGWIRFRSASMTTWKLSAWRSRASSFCLVPQFQVARATCTGTTQCSLCKGLLLWGSDFRYFLQNQLPLHKSVDHRCIANIANILPILDETLCRWFPYSFSHKLSPEGCHSWGPMRSCWWSCLRRRTQRLCSHTWASALKAMQRVQCREWGEDVWKIVWILLV